MANPIRPTTFDTIIGQETVIQRLKITIAGCQDGCVFPHTIIDGPPGLGKTTIAQAIAKELNQKIFVLNGANLRSNKNIIPYLLAVEERTVLFIDEIHRLPKIVEEFLYPVMEDFTVTIMQEKTPELINIPQFTLIGATTSGGSLSQPFYDRFVIKEHLNFYEPSDLADLARLNAQKLGLMLSKDEMIEIAKRSKGTPRILNARLQWYKSFTNYHKKKMSIEEVFSEQGIDDKGFDNYDRKYINVLKNSKGTALGVNSISAMTGIAVETIVNNIEPFMIRMGYVIRTSKGRIIGKI
jgi:Holliday junction DNA helicase RuvB